MKPQMDRCMLCITTSASGRLARGLRHVLGFNADADVRRALAAGLRFLLVAAAVTVGCPQAKADVHVAGIFGEP